MKAQEMFDQVRKISPISANFLEQEMSPDLEISSFGFDPETQGGGFSAVIHVSDEMLDHFQNIRSGGGTLYSQEILKVSADGRVETTERKICCLLRPIAEEEARSL